MSQKKKKTMCSRITIITATVTTTTATRTLTSTSRRGRRPTTTITKCTSRRSAASSWSRGWCWWATVCTISLTAWQSAPHSPPICPRALAPPSRSCATSCRTRSATLPCSDERASRWSAPSSSTASPASSVSSAYSSVCSSAASSSSPTGLFFSSLAHFSTYPWLIW